MGEENAEVSERRMTIIALSTGLALACISVFGAVVVGRQLGVGQVYQIVDKQASAALRECQAENTNLVAILREEQLRRSGEWIQVQRK